MKKGRYGGTYAHKDIAFEFGSAIRVGIKITEDCLESKVRNEADKYDILVYWGCMPMLSYCSIIHNQPWARFSRRNPYVVEPNFHIGSSSFMLP